MRQEDSAFPSVDKSSRHAVDWGVARQLAVAWILTFPICGAISWTVVTILRSIRQTEWHAAPAEATLVATWQWLSRGVSAQEEQMSSSRYHGDLEIDPATVLEMT